MKLTRFALNRPVTTLMLFSGIVLLGFICWQRLTLELLPSLNYPQITILTSYENVSPPEIESLISKPIEEVVGTIQGVTRVESISKEGISLVRLDFDWGMDMNLAALDVREKLGLIRDTLPRDIDEPIIIKFDPNAYPIMTLAVTGRGASKEFMREASEEIKQRLERIPGVALARISGMLEREVLVSVNQGRLYAYSIPIRSIVERLKRANFNFPGGSIEQGDREIRIRTIGKFRKIQNLLNIVIKNSGTGGPIFLRDVASVQETFKERTSCFLVNGVESVGISIFKQADSNTVRVAEDTLRSIKELNADFGPKVKIKVLFNEASFIKGAISDLEIAGILGGLIAFFVLFLFLRSLPMAIIITTAIPISVLGTFTLMYMTNISLNLMSLGGLALGVGLLVDNGIVILENVYRHLEKGADLRGAAITGSEEMTRPVVAATLAHIVVFLPIIFVKGLPGKFFSQLAFTISFSLIMSIIVALMLNPLLTVKILEKRRDSSGGSNEAGLGYRKRNAKGMLALLDTIGLAVGSGYQKLLTKALKNRVAVLVITLSVCAVSVYLLGMIGKEFLPEVDQGNFVIRMISPPGTPLETTAQNAREIVKIVASEPDVKVTIVTIGYDKKEKMEMAFGEPKTNVAKITVVLKDDRKSSTKAFVDKIRKRVAEACEVETEYLINQDIVQLLRQKRGSPELVEIGGNDLAELQALAQQVVARLKPLGFLKDVKSSVEQGAPEFQVRINKEKAALSGLTVKQVATSVKTSLEGDVAGTYQEKDREIEIVVRLRSEDRKDISSLERILVHSKYGGTVFLKEIAEVVQGRRLNEIKRRDLTRIAIVSASISGLPFDKAASKIKDALKDIKIPSGYYLKIGQQKGSIRKYFNSLGLALALSVLLVYMLLASLFESLIMPFIIMFAVPLAAVGVILTLFLTGTTISLGVYIGGIMLAGIVVNNSIILVDYTNRIRNLGTPLFQAVVQAGTVRLRPIVMTALTTILGLLPLAMNVGKGAEIRTSLALTVIGGLSVSTLMTLVVVPVVYVMLEDLRAMLRSHPKS